MLLCFMGIVLYEKTDLKEKFNTRLVSNTLCTAMSVMYFLITNDRKV